MPIAEENTPNLSQRSETFPMIWDFVDNRYRSLYASDFAQGGNAVTTAIVNSMGDSNSLIIRSNAGNVFSIGGSINAAGKRYLQLFNASGIPSSGAAPFAVLYIPSGESDFDFLSNNTYSVTTGCVAALSSTRGTYSPLKVNEMFLTATIGI